MLRMELAINGLKEKLLVKKRSSVSTPVANGDDNTM